MSAPRKLSPSRNGAAYPTLKDAKHDRRLVLAGLGAAALVGLNACLGGEPPVPPPGPDGGGIMAIEDAGASQDGSFVGSDSGGIYPADAALPGEDSGGSDPDAGLEGGDS